MKYIAMLKVDNDVLLKGDSCCTSLAELYTALVDKNATEIEITKPFADQYFTYTALCEFVENSAAIAPNVRIYVDDTIQDNMSAIVKDLKLYTTPDVFIYALEKNPSKVISAIQELCNYYLEAHEEANAANNKIANMYVQLEEMSRKLKYNEQDYNELLKVKNDIDTKLHALVSRVNYRYEKALSVDNMFVAKHNSFKHVLYIKEITRVTYLDTLLYYLQQIMKTMYSMPVRSVVIEPYYSYGREDLYPDFVPHWKLKYNDVYSGDIFMAGYQPKLMADILQDSNHINFLIVLDRGGYRVPHIEGNNVSVVTTVSDIKDTPEDAENVISYDPSNSWTIPYIDCFDDLSPEVKLQKYSSMPIMKHLINLLEEVK